MEMRRLGVGGPEVSLVGLGCNNFGTRIDEARSREVVQAALDAGITHFDTAERYGDGLSEEYLGRALGKRRDEVVIATKFAQRPPGQPYAPGLLRRRILDSCEASLRRLGTDYIDLYYQHYPDPEAPVEEALVTLGELQKAGKVRHAACSNYDAHQIDEAGAAAAKPAAARFVACQLHWNLLSREVEEELVPGVLEQGMGIVPYFPLESGLLTGKYRGPDDFPPGSRLAHSPRFRTLANPETFAYLARLRDFAEGRGHTLLELAMGWLAAQPGVASVIAGATTTEQVRGNVAAGTAWRLSPEDLEAVPRRTPPGGGRAE